MSHHLGWVALFVACGAFVIGSIPVGVLVSRRFFGSDIRAAGSGNIGAANALRTYGRGAGATVLVLDALKGALPTFVELHIAGDGAAATAALFAVLGHCYSPWLRYRGGKGVAATWLAVVAWRRVASLGSLAATIASAVVLVLAYRHVVAIALAATLATLVIVLKHRTNIARLRAGREPKLAFGTRRAARATGPSGRGG